MTSSHRDQSWPIADQPEPFPGAFAFFPLACELKDMFAEMVALMCPAIWKNLKQLITHTNGRQAEKWEMGCNWSKDSHASLNDRVTFWEFHRQAVPLCKHHRAHSHPSRAQEKMRQSRDKANRRRRLLPAQHGMLICSKLLYVARVHSKMTIESIVNI